MTDYRTTKLESCEAVRLDGVEVQQNGIIRDNRGWIIGRADTDWMRYQWHMLMSGVCPCCCQRVSEPKEELNAERYMHLDRGTCENVNTDGYRFRFECSECGYSAIVHNCATRLDELPRFCPSCGCKVVSADG